MEKKYPIIVEFLESINPALLTNRGIEIISISKHMAIIHANGTRDQILDLTKEKNIKVISLSAQVKAI